MGSTLNWGVPVDILKRTETCGCVILCQLLCYESQGHDWLKSDIDKRLGQKLSIEKSEPCLAL